MNLPAALLLGAFLAAPIQAQVWIVKNPGATLSEDDATAAKLESSLNAFLLEAQAGEFTDACVRPEDLHRQGFYFRGVKALGPGQSAGAGGGSPPPTVLKSYSLDGERYLITVAFDSVREGVPFLHKIVEFLATPAGEGYRFRSPFDEYAKRLSTHTVGKVTYRFSGELDEERAEKFAAFHEGLGELTGIDPKPLEYFRFDSLDELLKAHGFVFDRTRCNFLLHDLGFVDDGGARYVTGTGHEDYVAGFLGDYLETALPDADQMYWPFVSGMCAYYGGYFLSGESVDVLKAQFADRRRAEPNVNFLEEFKKGRRSSVQRHFSYYVISAFLCQEAVEKHGFDAALRLAYSGPEGERFFDTLAEVLGITEADFHAAIVRLIGS